jgi:hypothetical protein
MNRILPLQLAIVLVLASLLSCPLAPGSNDVPDCAADAYEPNDSLRESYHLGTIEEDSPEASFAATLDTPADGDFFRFHAEEGVHSCAIKEDQQYQVRIRLITPAGNDYDLALYDNKLDLLDSSSTPGDAEETITFSWNGKCGIDDSRNFRIEVSSPAAAGSCGHYTLSIDMWNL